MSIRKSVMVLFMSVVMLLCGCGKSTVNVKSSVDRVTVYYDGHFGDYEHITEENLPDNMPSQLRTTIIQRSREADKNAPNYLYSEYALCSNGDFKYLNYYDFCDNAIVKAYSNIDGTSDTEAVKTPTASGNSNGCVCTFSSEKVSDYYAYVLSFDLQEYEITTANADGVMITDYPKCYIVIDYKSNNGDIDTKLYTLSEDDCKSILARFDELKQIAEKNAK